MSAVKYFVTGASGFIGRRVCEVLIKSGAEVMALTRSADAELIKIGVKLWVGDLWDEKLLEEAILLTNTVIHCAGAASFGNGKQYQKENVELTEFLIKITKQCTKDARFIYISTIGAVDRYASDQCSRPITENTLPFPKSDYGKSKLQAEEALKSSGLSFSIIRPAMVVGDRMRTDSHFSVFARLSLSGSLIARFGWTGKFSVVHIDDLVNGIVTIAKSKDSVGETYFCAGEAISVEDYFKQCNPEKSRISLSLISVVVSIFPKWIPFPLKAMLLPALTASDDKLRALGWGPQYSAQGALAEVINRERFRINPDLSPGGHTVITGAASGLGRALAVYLSVRRDNLLLIDKDGPALEVLATELGNCVTSVVDLAESTQIDSLVNSEQWHAMNITELYACAGIGLRGRMQDISDENHRRMFSINVLARITLVRSVIASMQKRHFGRIVLISSSSAFQPLPYMATYAATNSALLSIGEAWAAEEVNGDVQIMTVCPGGMLTNFQKNGGVKKVQGEVLMTPEEVVGKIMDGLRQRRGTLMISFRSFAMSMLARCMPRSLSVKLWRRLMEKMR
jgi:uncharacterized protein